MLHRRMRLPEWEIEEAVVNSPGLAEIPGSLTGLKIIARQEYLPSINGYIDLLARAANRYVIVEIKSGIVKTSSPIRDQLLVYTKAFCKERNQSPTNVVGVLLAQDFRKGVREFAESNGVYLKKIAWEDIVASRPTGKAGIVTLKGYERTNHLISLRHGAPGKNMEERSPDINDYASASRWAEDEVHDSRGLEDLAKLFNHISERAPIMAHQVWADEDTGIQDSRDAWFWLFYSVLDRRSNAALFIRARVILEECGLFFPNQIVRQVKKTGYESVARTVRRVLRSSNFPLLVDSVRGEAAFPSSILDAALLVSKYDFDFMKWYGSHLEQAEHDPQEACLNIWNELRAEVYGVGPRIASQFIRGMVLKGFWDFPLTDSRFLEKNTYNLRFAGETRLGLLEDPAKFEEVLGQFADSFLDGNKAVVSHVLWYLRKRFCDRALRCFECPFKGHCHFYRKNYLLTDTWPIPIPAPKGARPRPEIQEEKGQESLASFLPEPELDTA